MTSKTGVVYPLEVRRLVRERLDRDGIEQAVEALTPEQVFETAMEECLLSTDWRIIKRTLEACGGQVIWPERDTICNSIT